MCVFINLIQFIIIYKLIFIKYNYININFHNKINLKIL